MAIYSKQPAIQVRGQHVSTILDPVCLEDTYRLYLNGQLLVQLVASPGQLKELGAGYIVCEGLARQVREVRVSTNDIRVSAESQGATEFELRSSGCIGVRGMPATVQSSCAFDAQDVFRAIAQIESQEWKDTGGVHCSVLLRNGEVVARASDIGRHNTVDKVVGYAVLHGIELSECMLGCTGRQPAGMISKIANAGIPLVVSKAASTDSGILLAERSGVTLIGFARGDRFTVYAHPERIRGLPAQPSDQT